MCSFPAVDGAVYAVAIEPVTKYPTELVIPVLNNPEPPAAAAAAVIVTVVIPAVALYA